MQSIAQRLIILSEAKAKGQSVPKYVDRQLIDYWRTVQGTPVGFHGKVPGEGVPIAGPPVLTGGSGSSNPLLAPLLKKYPEGTFVGGAIRKQNFPLSLTVFFDNVLGDEQAIRERMAELKTAFDENRSLNTGMKLDPFFKGKPLKWFDQGMNNSQRTAFGMITDIYDNPANEASVACKILNSLGVSGTLKPSDRGASIGDTESDIRKILISRDTSLEIFKDVVRDMYLLNQLSYSDEDRERGYENVTRGMGSYLPGLNGADSSNEFIATAKQSGASVRFAGNRAISSTASGEKSGFCCFGFKNMPVPIEATLSSWRGLKAQGGMLAGERETVVMGIADLAIDPKYLSNNTSNEP